jgi:hypothetical protein
MRQDVCGAPPPAAAEAALEQLAKAIHKQPQHMHLILVPCLMTAYWHKLLGKICTLTFTVPAGTDIWSISHFEPLISGFYLPLIRHYPWKWGGAYFVATSHGSEDLGNHIFKCGAGVAMFPWIMVNFPLLNQWIKGDLRCKISQRNGGIRRTKKETTLLPPFSMTYAILGTFCKRYPVQNLAQDLRILKLIRRANLDAFWAREPSRV